MATHLLWQAEVADFDSWYEVFKEDRAARRASGIHVLHVWRDPDDDGRAWAVFELTDPDRAMAFFDSEELAMHREREGIRNVQLKVLLTP
jgi:hypothetical protein